MIKRIAVIAFYILLPAGLFVLLGFAVENNKSMPCRSFRIHIDTSEGLSFLDSVAVKKQVYAAIDTLEGKKFRDISLNRIEELVNTMYYVDNSRVYRTIDGYLNVDVTQRVPVARVINRVNETFYIDTYGKLMKPSSNYTARVPVVSGFVNTRYSPNINITDFEYKSELSSSERVLKELNELIHYIRKDEFLDAWIDQIYVTRQGQFELVPRNGAHIIEFGNVDMMEEKFEKLMKFYTNGLTHLGWGSYKRINLQFKNQVVCSK
jgi:cell division protein FtsQ